MYDDEPDFDLLRMYQNEEVYLCKEAGLSALAPRAAAELYARRRLWEQEAQAEELNEEFQRLRRNGRFEQIYAGARRPRNPMILMARRPVNDPDVDLGMSGGMGLGLSLYGRPRMLTGADVPVGMDEGMIRMASAIGAEFAYIDALTKEAVSGRVIPGRGLVRGISLPKAPSVAPPKVPGVAAPSYKITKPGTAVPAARMPQAAGPPKITTVTEEAAKKPFLERLGINTPTRAAVTLGGLALAGGGAYGAARLADGTANLMSQPNMTPSFNAAGATPAQGLNEYGQPQRY